MELPDAFDTFYERIKLGDTPRRRIESAISGLTKHLAAVYGISASAIFPQGSYPNGTAVEPADEKDGEYDADLVAECADSEASADDALDDLESKLAKNSTYAELIKKEGARKKPCVRLRYADDEVGGFHVDVVPARASTSDEAEAPLEVPRRSEGWNDTAPEEFTEWAASLGPRFARTVMMLKRWRDEKQTARQSIKSIVLQVLAATALGSERSDGEALVTTLDGIQALLAASPNTAPRIENPVLSAEDLGERWTDSAYRDFRRVLGEALKTARAALASTDAAESHRLWHELLGEDFPSEPTEHARPKSAPPVAPPPGFEKTQQQPYRRERYG